MKIAVTSQGEVLISSVDSRLGRSKYFVIYDTDTASFYAADNKQNVNALQGAGIQAAGNLASHNVDFVITGHCGPKAFKALDTAGIKIIVGVEGSVDQAIRSFLEGKLKLSETPDVEGHW